MAAEYAAPHHDWLWNATTPEEVVKLVKSGQNVFLHGACATSLVLEAALAKHVRSLEKVRFYQLHKEGGEPLVAPDLADHCRVIALFCGSGIRKAVEEGRADFVPVFLSDIPHLFRNRQIPLDVAVIQVSAPDVHGFCSLGTSVDVARAAVQSADVVIAEINRRMPRTHGDSFLHISDLDAYCVTDRPLPEHAPKAPDETSVAIGQHIAEMIPDGATLQLGIGTIPDAVLASLGNKLELGIHSEMFSDGVVDLFRAGVITNRQKTVHPGQIITSFINGSSKTFGFVHDNPCVQFYPSDYTNDTALIRRHDNMIAINCAIEVDLTGQVCADSIGERIFSGIGGQMDFIRGAALAKNGKAIIALPSTAKNGTISRIAATLAPGAGVVTTRGHVQFIVTEFGVADLRGRSLRERAEALIAIAHPDHRAELTRHLKVPHSVLVSSPKA